MSAASPETAERRIYKLSYETYTRGVSAARFEDRLEVAEQNLVEVACRYTQEENPGAASLVELKAATRAVTKAKKALATRGERLYDAEAEESVAQSDYIRENPPAFLPPPVVAAPLMISEDDPRYMRMKAAIAMHPDDAAEWAAARDGTNASSRIVLVVDEITARFRHYDHLDQARSIPGRTVIILGPDETPANSRCIWFDDIPALLSGPTEAFTTSTTSTRGTKRAFDDEDAEYSTGARSEPLKSARIDESVATGSGKEEEDED